MPHFRTFCGPIAMTHAPLQDLLLATRLPRKLFSFIGGQGLRSLWAVLVWACLALAATASQAACRIAFDLGSSGVRAAVDQGDSGAALPWRDIDLLTPLMAGGGLEPLLPRVAAALRELPQKASWPDDCVRLGGGFSAWRLAWRLDKALLASQLEQLRQQTGVAVLVIPVAVEGGYGHASAKRELGPRLATSHILDIGGGSMQVAGQGRSFGIELGQKSLQRHLCQALGRGPEAPCALQALSPEELQRARRLVSEQLRELAAEVGPGTLTAISRPVTRGMRMAMAAMGYEVSQAIAARDVSLAIDRLASLDLAQTRELTQAPTTYLGYLLSDMLLVEAVLQATGNTTLAVAEAHINNLPALLRDERAFAWAQAHACYVQRLRDMGPSAYYADPAACPRP